MKALMIAVLIAPCAASLAQTSPFLRPANSSPVPPFSVGSPNPSFEPLGVSDLVQLDVYGSPELSHTFRVDQQGNLNLPLLYFPLRAEGLVANALRDEIANALSEQHLLVRPFVSVLVLNRRTGYVSIAGAVKAPGSVQGFGTLRLLGAISEAGGLLPEAGPEIIVQHSDSTDQRFSVRKLFDGLHPEMNVPVSGGSQIIVPTCERVFVVGNVKHPGAFPFQDVEDTTVLQLLALSGGLDTFSRSKAYIYRLEPGRTQKTEIEVPLRLILDRKASDVKLSANDILYVPVNDKMKMSATMLGLGDTASNSAIFLAH